MFQPGTALENRGAGKFAGMVKVKADLMVVIHQILNNESAASNAGSQPMIPEPAGHKFLDLSLSQSGLEVFGQKLVPLVSHGVCEFIPHRSRAVGLSRLLRRATNTDEHYERW